MLMYIKPILSRDNEAPTVEEGWVGGRKSFQQ